MMLIFVVFLGLDEGLGGMFIFGFLSFLLIFLDLVFDFGFVFVLMVYILL